MEMESPTGEIVTSIAVSTTAAELPAPGEIAAVPTAPSTGPAGAAVVAVAAAHWWEFWKVPEFALAVGGAAEQVVDAAVEVLAPVFTGSTPIEWKAIQPQLLRACGLAIFAWWRKRNNRVMR